jgi:predicted ribosome-associated RNA-binding protein Tma20
MANTFSSRDNSRKNLSILIKMNMKEGDIVVCINSNGKKQLTIGKQYIINIIGICDGADIFEMGIIDDDDRHNFYMSTRFISLDEYRENKINEIIK